MRTIFIVALFAVGGSAALYLGLHWLARWRDTPTLVSAKWLRENERDLNGKGLDGVNWRWPVVK
jgi:hypothetical protein